VSVAGNPPWPPGAAPSLLLVHAPSPHWFHRECSLKLVFLRIIMAGRCEQAEECSTKLTISNTKLLEIQEERKKKSRKKRYPRNRDLD
jgi:hypothetical protein